jgi:DNA replication protein DnaC
MLLSTRACRWRSMVTGASSCKVLIVDEFGVWPYDRVAVTALFALISVRYERGSIILTSNKSFPNGGTSWEMP